VTDNIWRRTGRPLSIAHRGHSIAVPENTTASYRRAIELGVEMIEADVNVTRDGRLVMIHDTSLDRTTNGTGFVRDFTLDEIGRLDAGSPFDPSFAGLRVPTTEATLELIREAGIYVCFEVKGDSERESTDMARALVTLLAERDALGFALISGFCHPALAAAKQMFPELMLAPERLPDDVPVDAVEALRQAQALAAPIIQNHHEFLTPELMEMLHRNDVALWSWPTTGEDALVKSIELGADAVMGDDISLMIEVLDRFYPRPQVDGTNAPQARA
jgi:glycerophosphoryl diester phosphodiesterase